MKFNTPYEKQEKVGVIVCNEKKLTKDSQKDDCDINNILKKYKNGVQPETRQGIYGDFTEAGDFMESCEIVFKAQEQFNGLRSDIRKKFNHDPAQFLEYCNNPQNHDEMVKLGLAIKKPIINNEVINNEVKDAKLPN